MEGSIFLSLAPSVREQGCLSTMTKRRAAVVAFVAAAVVQVAFVLIETLLTPATNTPARPVVRHLMSVTGFPAIYIPARLWPLMPDWLTWIVLVAIDLLVWFLMMYGLLRSASRVFSSQSMPRDPAA
jgi:hypothetical protein